MDKYLELKTKNWDKWRFVCPKTDDDKLPLDGLILQSIKHDAWWLAADIRVVGVHINPSFYKKEYKYLRLNDANLPCTTPLEKIEVEAPGAPPDFASDKLKVLSGLRAVYETPEPVVADGKKLKITQTYLFTPYSDNPAHEPSGLLQAARIYPLIKIEYPEDDKVYSIRVDYRLEFKMDQLKKVRKEVEKAQDLIKNSPATFYNQAGVFRDDDRLNPDVFLSAEKPLVYEIYSDGLNIGMPFNPVTKKLTTWDNIHWWNKDDGLPSTPGAYHATHLHWRWGKYFQARHEGFVPEHLPVKKAGEPQFVSKTDRFVNKSDIGGPLLDPNIPYQSIRFAVARVNNSRMAENNTPRDMRLYFNADADPEQISGKHPKTKQEIRIDNLCIWYSTEVFSSKLSRKMNPQGINGTIFTHGLFFAHEPEATFKQNRAKGEPFASLSSKDELYINPSTREDVLKLLERYPQIPKFTPWIRGG